MARQLCCNVICKLVLWSDRQYWNHNKAKIASNLNSEEKIFSETDSGVWPQRSFSLRNNVMPFTLHCQWKTLRIAFDFYFIVELLVLTCIDIYLYKVIMLRCKYRLIESVAITIKISNDTYRQCDCKVQILYIYTSAESSELHTSVAPLTNMD